MNIDFHALREGRMTVTIFFQPSGRFHRHLVALIPAERHLGEVTVQVRQVNLPLLGDRSDSLRVDT